MQSSTVNPQMKTQTVKHRYCVTVTDPAGNFIYGDVIEAESLREALRRASEASPD